MVNESKTHEDLKEIIKKRYFHKNNLVMEEFKFNNLKFDLAIIDKHSGKIIKIIECLVTQTMINAYNKLVNLDLNVEKEIVRVKKNRNPKSRKVIEKIKSKGINFVEINISSKFNYK